MKGPVGLLGLFGGSDRVHAARPHEIGQVPIVAMRSGASDPGIAKYVDGTAAELAVDDDVDAERTVAGDILAAIDLVRRGIASRVTLTGFQVSPDLASAAEEVARASGCRVIPMIGRGGGISLVVTEGERKSG